MNDESVDPHFRGLRFRCIGPVRGGRVLAVAGHPTDHMVFYFGACAGGIWKTVDGGEFWENISDGFLKTAAVGALTVSDADPNVIYAGMGESTIRLDVSYGDGVYKSTDGGKSWAHMGLADTKHISEIRVHPTNPDLVYVAAHGHAFGPNAERGVYRSTDGGENWDLILHKSENAGCADLAMDPTNPRILFASMYQSRRSFWNLESGGEDSGLWRSTDGGDTWTDITANKGLPSGILGKIGVTVSPTNPDRVWAIIECKEGVVFRSDDGGDTWTGVSDNSDLIRRPWYYCHIFADPQDPETVYINNLKMWKSTDGGATFTDVPTPHGDNHDLWIDSENPQRMIQSNDGGANVSFNGGASWSSIYNQKTAQFYHVAADSRYPYHVLGTQQDNTSIAVPNSTENHVIPYSASYPAGTGESGYIAPHPDDPNIVYIGAIGSSPGGGNALQRYDHRTKQIQLITVWPETYLGRGAKDMKYRFAWTYPIVFSPHDSNTIYVGGNHVMKSTDEGHSWETISPDLTRADEATLQLSGGVLTPDTSGAETYATVFAFAESPHEPGVLWAGSDDGLVHLSTDAGATWEDITPSDFPEFTCVTMLEPSTHDAGTIYMSATRYKLDDYLPYLYKSSDRGRTWERLSNFPPEEITRCVREDPGKSGLLFVGTETGIFVSPDAGGSWHRLQGGGVENNRLPVVPVYDLVIKGDDLVVGTHGRAFWILDDISPLRELAGVTSDSVRLIKPRATCRNWLTWTGGGDYSGPGRRSIGFGIEVTNYVFLDEFGEMRHQVLNGGENPPDGVLIYYMLPEEIAAGSVSLTIKDSEGNELNSYGMLPEEPVEESGPRLRYVPASPGLNRFVWDMRLAECVQPKNDTSLDGANAAPRVAPGQYTAELRVGEEMQSQSFEIFVAPGVAATQEDLDAQFHLWRRINNKLTEIHESVNAALLVTEQVDLLGRGLEARSDLTDAEQTIVETATKLSDSINAVMNLLVAGDVDGSDRLRNSARINAKLAALVAVIGSADAAPTVQAVEAFEEFAGQADELLEQLASLTDGDVAALNELVKDGAVPAIVT